MFEITITSRLPSGNEPSDNTQLRKFGIDLLSATGLEGDDRFLSIGKILAEIEKYNSQLSPVERVMRNISFRVTIDNEIIVQNAQHHVTDVFKHVISAEGDQLDGWKISYGYHNALTYKLDGYKARLPVIGYLIPDSNYSYGFYLNDGAGETFELIKNAYANMLGSVSSVAVFAGGRDKKVSEQYMEVCNLQATGTEGGKSIMQEILSHGDLSNFIGAIYFKTINEAFGFDLKYANLNESFGELTKAICAVIDPVKEE